MFVRLIACSTTRDAAVLVHRCSAYHVGHSCHLKNTYCPTIRPRYRACIEHCPAAVQRTPPPAAGHLPPTFAFPPTQRPLSPRICPVSDGNPKKRSGLQHESRYSDCPCHAVHLISVSRVAPTKVGQITTHTDGPVNAATATAAQASTREGEARRVEAIKQPRKKSHLCFRPP